MAVESLPALAEKVLNVLGDLGFRKSPQLFNGDVVPDTVEHRNAQVVPGDFNPKATFGSIDWHLGMGISIAYQVGQADEMQLVLGTVLPDLQSVVTAIAVLEETEPGDWQIEIVSGQNGQVVVLIVRVPMAFCQPLPNP